METSTQHFEDIDFTYNEKQYSGKMILSVKDDAGKTMDLFLWGDCAQLADQKNLQSGDEVIGENA